MVTGKEFSEIMGNTDGILGFSLNYIKFTFEEIQEYLIARGYEIRIISGLANVHYQSNDMEEAYTGNSYDYYKDEERKRVIAAKPGDPIPSRVDSQEAKDMDILNVFYSNLKGRLLNK